MTMVGTLGFYNYANNVDFLISLSWYIMKLVFGSFKSF
jgi:hypothetical protein